MKAKKYTNFLSSFIISSFFITQKIFNNILWRWEKTSIHELYQDCILASQKEKISAIILDDESPKAKNAIDAFIKKIFSWKKVVIVTAFDDINTDCTDIKANMDCIGKLFFLVKVDHQGNYWVSKRPCYRQVAITMTPNLEEYFAFNSEHRLLRLSMGEKTDRNHFRGKSLPGIKFI